MPTRGSTDGVGLGDAARQVTERASAIARLELELAGLELKGKVKSLGIGIGLAVAAGVFGFFAVGVGIATAIAGLAVAFPVWLASLIVFGVLAVLAGSLGVLGAAKIKRGAPPVPEQAIEEARRTTAAIKGNGA